MLASRLNVARSAFGAVVLGCACSSEAPVSAEGAGGLAGTVGCASDPRVDTYSAGMSKLGERGALSFRILSSDPSPPGRGTNTFELDLTSSDGNSTPPALGVNLLMPDHGHGARLVPRIVYQPASATFSISPLDLFMAGVWRIEFTARASDTASAETVDDTAFHFCVEG